MQTRPFVAFPHVRVAKHGSVDIARLLRKARSASGTVWHTQLAHTAEAYS